VVSVTDPYGHILGFLDRSRYFNNNNNNNNKTPWSEPASELYLTSDRRLSAKLLSTFEDRGCHVVSLMDPYGRILGFLDQSSYFFSFKWLLSCTHEAEWTPFQTHYFLENVVAPIVELRPLDM
jgi:hypothetical protein